MTQTTQTVLITGASSGFGAACARRFASPQFRLVLVARRTERLAALQAELENRCEVHMLPLDITNAQAVSQVEDLPPPFNEVDILINNAGLALGLGPANEADLSQWETMINTNNLALVRITRLLLPGMVSRNRGHVVNIGSVAGNWPYPGGNVYGASKAFVKHFSRGLRADLLGKRIRISNIEPGMAETEFSLVRFQDESRAAKVYEGVKPLSGDDIADVVYWVCTAPPHVNINAVEVMPICQAWAPLAINRQMED